MKTFKTILISLLILLIVLELLHSPQKGGRYYLPEKYAGWVCVSYEVEGMPPLDIQDDFLIYKIPQNGVLKTSSKPRLYPKFDEYYYYTKEGTREAEEIESGGGHTVRMQWQRGSTSYFWISSGDMQADYDKYVKDSPVMDENGVIDPVCGQWEKGKK